MNIRNAAGFTLVELMITMAIVGILAAVAFPSYQQHVRKSRRAQVQADLVELAQFMERNFTVAGRYDQTSTGTTITKSSLSFNVSPRGASGKSIMYNIDFAAAPTANAYTLKATRNTSSAQASDDCGELTLTQAGTKGVVDPKAGFSTLTCWRQ